MAAIPSLQKIRETVRQLMAENIAGESNGSKKPLHNAMAVVNQSSMWRMVQWLTEIILPKIEKDRGRETQEYINFEEIRDGLVMAMYVVGQYEASLRDRGKDKQLLKFYVMENARLEAELTKYATVEQLLANESMEVYKQSIIVRAINRIEEEKKAREFLSKPNTPNNENAK